MTKLSNRADETFLWSNRINRTQKVRNFYVYFVVNFSYFEDSSSGIQRRASVECQPTFRGTYRFHSKGRGICRARNQSSTSYLFHAGFLLVLVLEPEDGRDMKRYLTVNGLHVVIPQKRQFFITTAVETSNTTSVSVTSQTEIVST